MKTTLLDEGWVRAEFPNGTALDYRDSDHKYRAVVDGVRGTENLVSSSALGKAYDIDPGGLQWWSADTNLRGVAKLVDGMLSNSAVPVEQLRWLQSPEGIWAKLKEAKLTYWDDPAAYYGTLTHRYFEQLARGDERPPTRGQHELVYQYSLAVWRWWQDKRPEVYETEQFVYSAEHGFAGRFDLRAGFDNLVARVDLKTGKPYNPKRPSIPTSYHLQLRSYELGAKDCGLPESERQLVLRVYPDGSWREIPTHATDEKVIKAVQVCREAKQLDAETKADDRAVLAA